jgi:hypothetical protein
MLNWITGRFRQDATDNPDHPLGTEAAIQEFLGELPPSRHENNLLEVVAWLSEPERLTGDLSTDGFLRAVMRLDEFAQSQSLALWTHVLAERRIDHLVEQKLRTLESFYNARHLANLLGLKILRDKPDVGGSNAATLRGLVAQRAMAGLAGRLRVMRVRYRGPDSHWWAAVTEILKIAQAMGVINLRQRSYPDDAAPSSCWVELLIVLFFEIAPVGNCTPQQMELLYRVLRWLEPHFMVQDTYSPQAQWMIRLDSAATPAKSIGAVAPDPALVFFGPGLAYSRLVGFRSTLATAKDIPDWLATTYCAKDAALATVDAMIMHWSERPPQRRHKRMQSDSHLRVSSGFANIRRVIAFSEFARSGRKIGYKSHLEMLKFERRGFADSVQVSKDDEEKWQNATPLQTLEILETAGDKQMMDDWISQDLSDTGIGATAPFLRPWMSIGAYAGYRVDGEVDWRIGIIRRIHRTEHGHPSVGLETFTEVPSCAQVRRIVLTKPDANPWHEATREGGTFEDAIVLSMMKSMILLPAGMFMGGAHMVLMLAGQRFPIKLLELVHRNPDCDCIRFEMCDQGE